MKKFLLPLVLLAAIFGIPRCMASCIGHEEAAVSWLEECPQARELLGSPIAVNNFGCSCGNAEVDGGFGHATWHLPVKGPKGAGGFDFNAERHGGHWQLINGGLEAGDNHVDVGLCIGHAQMAAAMAQMPAAHMDCPTPNTVFEFPSQVQLTLCNDAGRLRNPGQATSTLDLGGGVRLVMADKVVFEAKPTGTLTQLTVKREEDRGVTVTEELRLYGKGNDQDGVVPLRSWFVECVNMPCTALAERCLFPSEEVKLPSVSVLTTIKNEIARDKSLRAVRADWWSGNHLANAALLLALSGNSEAQSLINAYPEPPECGVACQNARADLARVLNAASQGHCIGHD